MTLIEHIDALDEMIVKGSSEPKIRSQIAFIKREVAVLQSQLHQTASEYQRLEVATDRLKVAQAQVTPSIEIVNQSPLPPIEPLL